jgi:hypothetical protein
MDGIQVNEEEEPVMRAEAYYKTREAMDIADWDSQRGRFASQAAEDVARAQNGGRRLPFETRSVASWERWYAFDS